MTAMREAIILPAVFLTVLLLAGLRLAETTALVAPTPYTLILGVLLVRLLVQTGALAPNALNSSARSPLENLTGIVVLTALWIAASQIFALLTPESGLPRLAFSVFFLILLLNTAAASPNRERALRSFALIFGAAFVLKFVVLQTMSAPGESPAKRALLALVDSVTAGVLIQDALDPISGYLAFAAVALFLIGLSLLPHRRELSDDRLMRTRTEGDEAIITRLPAR